MESNQLNNSFGQNSIVNNALPLPNYPMNHSEYKNQTYYSKFSVAANLPLFTTNPYNYLYYYRPPKFSINKSLRLRKNIKVDYDNSNCDSLKNDDHQISKNSNNMRTQRMKKENLINIHVNDENNRKRRYQNMINSRKCRLKKKIYTELLTLSYIKLEEENRRLKQVIAEKTDLKWIHLLFSDKNSVKDCEFLSKDEEKKKVSLPI